MSCIVKKQAVEYTLSVLGGKWKWLILYCLLVNNVLRYGEIKKLLTGITHKMLSQQLKELESEGLIYRNEYHQVPPKVEYSITEKGATLVPVLASMVEWGERYLDTFTI